jgi:hypothetical protein
LLDEVDLACGLGAAEALGVGFGGGGTLGLAVGLPVALGLALVLAVELPLALPLPLGVPWLVVAVVPWLVARAAVLACCAAAFDEPGGDVEHDGLAARLTRPGGAALRGAPVPNPLPAPAELVGPGAELCELKPRSTDWTIPWRIGGTVASTTPTANSAKPTAKAGRSIASRQSRGRCGAGRTCPGFAGRPAGTAGRPRSACQRRTRAARKPAFAAACESLAVA